MARRHHRRMSKRRSEGTSRPRGKHRARHHLTGARAGFLDRNPHVRTLLGRIDRDGLTWEDVADDILPVFERARPFPFGKGPPTHAIVPPGVTVGFGVDLGLAFARVGPAQLEDWPVDLAGLTERALRNLRRRAKQ